MLKSILKVNEFKNLTRCWRCYSKYKKKPKPHVERRILIQDTSDFKEFNYPKSRETDKRLYVWGHSETGALGIVESLKKQSQKHTAFIQHPTRHRFGEKFDIVTASCGYGFTLFTVKAVDGFTLFGTGINFDSQLGYHCHRGETNKPLELLIKPAPIELTTEDAIIKCAAGRAHSLALSSSGVAYALGNNAFGQCGRKVIPDENYQANTVINKIELPEKISEILCGQDHSLFITESGKLYSCGWGSDGQTGLSHYNIADEPSLVGGDISNEVITKVACSADCVIALNCNGEVFGWGNSEYGQLEYDKENQQINKPQYLTKTKKLGKIIDIASGGSYCLVLNENHDVFIWGYGLLGMGPNADYLKEPTQIPSTLFGKNDFNPDSIVTSIYSGISHMGAINSDGDLFMWGKNKLGCLGLGHTKDQYFPLKIAVAAKVESISCGVDHTLAICKPFI